MLRPANVLGEAAPFESEVLFESGNPDSAAVDEGSLFV